jgi:cell division protein ZapE
MRAANNVAWFDFDELCGGAHAHEDYLAIAHRYPTVLLSHIPRLTADHSSETKRFTWLVDVLYDNHVRLIASADATPETLSTAATGEFARTTSRLTEMQSARYLELRHNAQNVEL